MNYTIQVFRPTAVKPGSILNEGRLRFKHGNIFVNTPCWWSTKRIDPGVYAATATTMEETGYKAIWLKMKVPQGFSRLYPGLKHFIGRELWAPLPVDNGERTATEVFIHQGKSPKSSTACIAAAQQEVMKIWNSIEPINETNILVYVYDAEPANPGGYPLPLL